MLGNIARLLAFSGAIVLLASCSKWDDFKQYIEDGEISYTGKLDSVRIYPGNERVRLLANFPADPKIIAVRVFWNDGADSVEFDVDRSTSGKVFDQVLTAEEGVNSFVIYTYDEDGNTSVPVNAVGRAYGPRYQSGLNNRQVSSAVVTEGETVISWVEMDQSAGPFATELTYQSAGKEKVIRVPITEEVTVLTDIDPEATTVSFRTLFLPQPTSIDTFYSSSTVSGLSRDVTDQYLRNTRVPVETTVRGERWGIPTDWITNTAVRNFRDASGNYLGGVDYWFDGPFLAMEAGWSEDNMATITNGKIYQTPTLPPGIYTIEMDIPDCTQGAEFYTVVAEGEEIPDIDQITSSLAYLKTSMPGTHSLTFTLAETTKVALGFVGHLENKGAGDGTFWRITRVALRQQTLVE